MPLGVGDWIDRRYRITTLIGRGGMGEVWAAIDHETADEVAIKILLERAARKSDIVARFRREAKATACVKSPFVCALLDTGRTEAGGLYLVFERLRGESLADRLRREQSLTLDEITPVVDDVLQGIADAHAAGVLHRDLKPGNIFLTRRQTQQEQAVILDFGVSKIVHAAKRLEEPSLTAYDGTVGSFAYMAPEQVRGAARVDARADIYAAGAVAFRALTGRLPFEGVTAKMVVSLKLGRPAPSLEQITGDKWPRVLEQFFARCLARTAGQRYPSAVDALAAWRSTMSVIDQSRIKAERRICSEMSCM